MGDKKQRRKRENQVVIDKAKAKSLSPWVIVLTLDIRK